MKVIVAGSRHITEYEHVEKAVALAYAYLFLSDDITEVVSGKAKGIDTLGERYARENNVPVKDFRANWTKYGNAAGPIRNKQMAEYADAAIVVWDGKSSGSKNMIAQMKKLGKPVFQHIIEENNDD